MSRTTRRCWTWQTGRGSYTSRRATSPARRRSFPAYLPEFVRGLLNYTRKHNLTYDAIHSHYWLSGRVGNVLARHWRAPHVATFHTLAEVKLRARAGESEPEARAAGERRVIASADRVVAFSEHEREAITRLYAAAWDGIEIIPCGVDVDPLSANGRRRGQEEPGFAWQQGDLVRGQDLSL